MEGYTNVYHRAELVGTVSEPSYYEWLKKNCTGKFYTGWAWDRWPLSVVEFENEADAILFTLKWVR